MTYELRYYCGAKAIATKQKDYTIHATYQLKETKNQYIFEFVKQGGYQSAHMPNKKDLKFSKNKGWTMEKLLGCFYPLQAGIPHWFQEVKTNLTTSNF